MEDHLLIDKIIFRNQISSGFSMANPDPVFSEQWFHPKPPDSAVKTKYATEHMLSHGLVSMD